jgi:hypothetical protein
LPAYPSAEGFGVNTRAGRFGAIIRVTNLNSAGAGSLRAALEVAGPRIVVFEVGGVIDIAEALTITQPYVTVAGQTAPSPGITVIGAGLVVVTHDVVVQHLRFRVGDRPEGPVPDARDGISVYASPDGAPSERVVIDHCSVSWALDEGMSTWTEGVRDVTFRQCIIAENLSRSIHPKGEHSKGLLVGDHARRIGIIGNLFAGNMQRNPQIKGDVSALVANNLIVNPGSGVIHFSDPEGSGPSLASIVGNVLVPGTDTRALLPMVAFERSTARNTQAYVASNLATGGHDVLRTSLFAPWEGHVIHDGPAPVWVKPLTLRPAEQVRDWVLTQAGARPTDRDAADARIVREAREGTGRIINSQEQVGGFPTAQPVERPLTLPENPTGDDDGDGYTDVEEWLHSLAATIEGR